MWAHKCGGEAVEPSENLNVWENYEKDKLQTYSQQPSTWNIKVAFHDSIYFYYFYIEKDYLFSGSLY